MADSNSIALLVRPPEFDLATPLLAASRIQEAQTNNELAQMKLRQANRQQGALDAYRKSGNLEDLKGEPDIYAKYSEMMDADQQRKLLRNARDAQSIMGMPAEQRAQAWPGMLETARREGRIDDATHARLTQTGPNDLVLQNVIQMASKIQTPLETAHADAYRAQAEKDRAQTEQLKNPPAGGFKTPKERYDAEEGLRKEIGGKGKEFGELRSGYSRVQEGNSLPGRAGDLAIVYGYVKTLDPMTGIREGEVANAEQAGGVPSRVLNLYNAVVRGDRLPPEARAEIMAASRALYERGALQHNKLLDQYRAIAKRMGVDEQNVILDDMLADRPQDKNAPPRFDAPRRPPASQSLPSRTQQSPAQSRPSGQAVAPLLPDQHAAAIKEANDAIRAGKDRAAVMKRLRDLGVEFEENQ